MAAKRAGSGQVTKLPSGRYRARYQVADAVPRRYVNAPTTFARKVDAQDWLAAQRTQIVQGIVRPATVASRVTLAEYAERWLATVLNSAVDDGLVATNPCRIRGASGTRAVVQPVVLTPAQVRALAAEMPDRLRLSIYLGARCQVRSGELLELRRRDFDGRSVRISRGVTWVDSQPVVGPPKTDAGVRAIAIPPHIRPAVEEHLATHANPGLDGLLFPAQPSLDRQIYGPTFADTFKRAARRAGLPESLRFHHLRHTGLTMLAHAGATLAELQARAGHSTPGIAMRYQHAVAARDEQMATALSALAEA